MGQRRQPIHHVRIARERNTASAGPLPTTFLELGCVARIFKTRLPLADDLSRVGLRFLHWWRCAVPQILVGVVTFVTYSLMSDGKMDPGSVRSPLSGPALRLLTLSRIERRIFRFQLE